MIKIQFLGLSPENVEGFSKGIKRTFKGALHLKPNCVYDMSKEEFDHVKLVRKDLKFHVFKSLGNAVKSKVQKKVAEKPSTNKEVKKN